MGAEVEIEKEARKYLPLMHIHPTFYEIGYKLQQRKRRATRGGRPYQAKMEKLLVEGKHRFSSALKNP